VWPDTARPECPGQESRLVMAVQTATDTGDIQCNGVITYECEQSETNGRAGVLGGIKSRDRASTLAGNHHQSLGPKISALLPTRCDNSIIVRSDG
jgi:hypothetical protein